MKNEDIKPKVVGKLKYDSDFNCGAKIYDTEGIAPTQQTITGGNLETKIIEYMDNKEQQTEPTIGAIRTRSYKGQTQTLEHNGSTESNAITSVQKDNVVIEPTIIQKVGDRSNSYWSEKDTAFTIAANPMSDRCQLVKEQQNFIEPINTTEDGLATTLTTAHHYSGNIVNPKRGQTEMGVIEYKTTEPLNPYNDGTSRTIKGQYQCTSTANLTRGDSLGATGAITFNGREYHEGEGLYTDQSKDFVRGRLDGVSRTLKSNMHDAGCVQNFRIRKLTPRECFRLMDVSEPDIDTLLNAGISNSQLYKLAGNSVVVSCLYHLFRKMFIETDMDYTGKPQQLNLF